MDWQAWRQALTLGHHFVLDTNCEINLINLGTDISTQWLSRLLPGLTKGPRPRRKGPPINSTTANTVRPLILITVFEMHCYIGMDRLPDTKLISTDFPSLQTPILNTNLKWILTEGWTPVTQVQVSTGIFPAPRHWFWTRNNSLTRTDILAQLWC